MTIYLYTKNNYFCIRFEESYDNMSIADVAQLARAADL